MSINRIQFISSVIAVVLFLFGIVLWPFKRIYYFFSNVQTTGTGIIAVLALIVSSAHMWANYRVDYGLQAYVRLAERPSSGDDGIYLNVTFINSGNQTSSIEEISFCYNFDDTGTWKSCPEHYRASGSDKDKFLEPIVIKPKEIIFKRLFFKNSPDTVRHYGKKGGTRIIDLVMFFTIINSEGIIYKHYKKETGISVFVDQDHKMDWYGNSSQNDKVIDLTYSYSGLLIKDMRNKFFRH